MGGWRSARFEGRWGHWLVAGNEELGKANLEVFMVPKKIVFLPEMPKSNNGKIDKGKLKKILSV